MVLVGRSLAYCILVRFLYLFFPTSWSGLPSCPLLSNRAGLGGEEEKRARGMVDWRRNGTREPGSSFLEGLTMVRRKVNAKEHFEPLLRLFPPQQSVVTCGS